MRNTRTIQFISLALLVAVAAGYLSITLSGLMLDEAKAGASTAPAGSYHLIALSGGDSVWNWDFRSGNAASTNVDWGMRFIFAENAEIDKVKDRLDGHRGDLAIDPPLSSQGGWKYAWVDDSTERGGSNPRMTRTKWDTDRGIVQYDNCQMN